MNPVTLEQSRERLLLRAAASKLDNANGVGIHAAAAEQIIAGKAPRYDRQARNQRLLDRHGIVTEYGNNTPARIIHGFEVKKP